MTKKRKLWIGGIFVFIISVVLYYKPILKIIGFDTIFYKTPANSAFNDINFYKCVIDAYNYSNQDSLNYDVSLTDDQLASVTSLTCAIDHIFDLSGIEKMTNLESLNLSDNQITSIDLSRNLALNELDLGHNQLASVDLSHNTALTVLNLQDNEIESIDLSNNKALQKLILKDNSIESINLSQNAALVEFDLSYNAYKLESIDLSHNVALKKLNLSRNKLVNIDLSHNVALIELNLSDNQLENIDLGHNTALTSLNLFDNCLNGIDLRYNIALETLNLSRNILTNIDLMQNASLKKLFLNDNNLTSINFSYNVSLMELNLSYNQLTSIDLSHNIALQKLNLGHNQLTSIDLSRNVALESIDISGQTKEYVLYKNELSKIIEPELIDKITGEGLNPEYTIFYSYVDSDGSQKTFGFNYLVEWIEVTSSKYIINDDYFYTYQDNEIDMIKYKIQLTKLDGVEGTFENGKYIVRYNGDVLKEFDIVNCSSSKYDMSKDYLINESIYNIYNDYLFKVINCTNCVLNFDYDNNIISVKHNNIVLDEYDYVSYISEKYDMSKDYLTSGNIMAIQLDYSLGIINCTNCYLEFDGAVIRVKYNDEVLKEYVFVGYVGDGYDLNKSYVKVEDENIGLFLSKIDCTNCTAYIYDGTNYLTTGYFDDNYTLRIMYSNDLVKEFQLKYSVSGVQLNKSNLSLNIGGQEKMIVTVSPDSAANKNVTWESSDTSVATVDNEGNVSALSVGEATITVKTVDGDFTDTCLVTVSGTIKYIATFVDGNNTYISEYEEGEDVVFKTDLEKTGYRLVGWKYNNQDYGLQDRLVMPSNDIELTAIWELIIPEINYESSDNVITGIGLDVDISNLDLGIDSIYQIKVFGENGVKIQGKIGTGNRIEIYLGNQFVTEYIVSIKGDINGDGGISISDASMIYKKLRESVTFTNMQTIASDLNNDSSISISDISMIYKYIKNHN